MKKGNYYYYKIDVMSRADGYSFMVRSLDEIDDQEAIDRAYAAGCFDDDGDLDKAFVDALIDETDIKAFENSTTTV